MALVTQDFPNPLHEGLHLDHLPDSKQRSSYELYSKLLKKGACMGILYGIAIGVIKGDTRSLDYGSYLGVPLNLRRGAGFFTI